MSDDTPVIRLGQPDEIDDPLTAILRSGARRLLEQAVEAEVEAFLATMKELKLANGRDGRWQGFGSRVHTGTAAAL